MEINGQVYFTPLDPDTGEPLGPTRHVGEVHDGVFEAGLPAINTDSPEELEPPQTFPTTEPRGFIVHSDLRERADWSTGAHANAAHVLALGVSAEDAARALEQMATRLDRTRLDLERARERTRRNRERLEALQASRGPVPTRQFLGQVPVPEPACATPADHVSFYRMGHWRCAKCYGHTCIGGGDCDPNVEFNADPYEWHKIRRPQGCEDLP